MSSVRIVLTSLAVDRTIRGVALASVVVTGLALLVSRLPTVGTPFGNEIVPWPLLPCIAPLFITTGLRGAVPTTERVSSRGALVPTALRLVVVVGAIAFAAAAVSERAPVGTVSAHGVVAWRNAALLTGVALLAAVRPGMLSWLPATVIVVVTATVGAPPGSAPPSWSLLLRSAGDTLPTVVGCVVLVAGLVATVALPAGRRPRRRTSLTAPS